MAILSKPQIPVPPSEGGRMGRPWDRVVSQLDRMDGYLRVLVRYLQDYLTRVYNAVATPQLAPAPFANLPPASAANEGMVAAVNDSTTNTWGATITGGGAFHVLAYSDGGQWTVIAK